MIGTSIIEIGIFVLKLQNFKFQCHFFLALNMQVDMYEFKNFWMDGNEGNLNSLIHLQQ